MINYGEFTEPVSATISTPAIISDGNTFAFWDFNTGVTKNGSNEVTEHADSLGSANTLLPVSGAKPIWSANGITTIKTENGLGTGVKTLSQPYSYYIVATVNDPVTGKSMMDGNGVLSSSLYLNNTEIRVSAYAGTLSAYKIISSASKYLFHALFNGASSNFGVNNDVITGNWGVGNASGITVGKLCGVTYQGILVRKIVDLDADVLSIKTFLRLKYGVTF